MKNTKNMTKLNEKDSQELAMHYMNTLVDVARECLLILDSKLRVVSANQIFLKTFHVKSSETQGKLLYSLGNGQWNIPELRKLLEEILPEKKVVRNYEVTHVFEKIGSKTMQLNARQVDTVQLIIIALEDITTRKELEKRLQLTVKSLAYRVAERTSELENRIKELERINSVMLGREIKMIELKKQVAKLRKNK